MFWAVSMSAFFLAVTWVFVPSLTRAIGKISADMLADAIPDMLLDESGIAVIVCVLLFVALVAVLRFIVQLIADLISARLGGGSQTLGRE